MKPASPKSEDYYRAIFLLVGMPYGRCFGSKGEYARGHPARLFIANACVLLRDRTCVWRGDIDLVTAADQQGLVSISRLLHRKLYILREESDTAFASLPPGWLTENAVAAAWQGKVETTGYTRRLHGPLRQLVS